MYRARIPARCLLVASTAPLPSNMHSEKAIRTRVRRGGFLFQNGTNDSGMQRAELRMPRQIVKLNDCIENEPLLRNRCPLIHRKPH
jgi:hypothetical protein